MSKLIFNFLLLPLSWHRRKNNRQPFTTVHYKFNSISWLLAILSLVYTNNLLLAAPKPSFCKDTKLTAPDCYPLNPVAKKNLAPLALKVIVNTNQDGAIQPDDVITLREAIQLVNGSLPLESLSQAEKAQIQVLDKGQTSRIEFNLPKDKTTIKLVSVLPPLASPGLIVDGTTQPGYDATKSATQEIAIPTPIVAITPADNVEVFRGLTIISDKIIIRGLSIYGFASLFDRTLTTPPADIFIAGLVLPPNAQEPPLPPELFPFYQGNNPPKNVVVENNWLGLMPDEKMPTNTSAFGVSVFNGIDTIIRRNRIYDHDASAIITSNNAENLQITENIIVGNGIAGMPDAIRLEGNIKQTQITSNLLCGNDGSAIYLFKSEGAINIKDNQIKFNGRRLRRAAIYLMGDDHQVINNNITDQTASGVTVAAYPESVRNIIQGNKFDKLEGLSIDLNTQQNVGVQDFEMGDGPNPPRNSPNRRLETGNAAIDAPRFLSREFFILGNKLALDGVADPNTKIDFYKITPGVPDYGNLHELIGSVTSDKKGKFSFIPQNLQVGDQVSAIATDPKYGTSEPAVSAIVRSLDNTTIPVSSQAKTEIPHCTTKPVIVQNPPPENPPVTPNPPPENPPVKPNPPPENPPVTPNPPVNEPIRLTVPSNVHFALDKSNISQASARVLDKIVQVLQQYPTIIIDIEGHTDIRASDDYNQSLGLRRAKAVRKYLLRQGIDPERMTIRSFGKTQPKEPGRARIDHARNRRVEITFKDYRGVEIILEEQEEDLQLEK